MYRRPFTMPTSLRWSALSVVLLTAVAGSIPGATGCPPCDELSCPKTEEECVLGVVADPCGCCPSGRCGLARGQSCYNLTVHGSELRKLGVCAQNMNCQVSTTTSEDGTGITEGTCVCTETQIACGSDNQTYDNICALKEAAAEFGYSTSLTVQHWGPCQMEPEIISSPQDVASLIGQPVMLDCEVKGYPTPVVFWEFTGNDGSVKMLPSDDPEIAIQVRGGPESQMATSWVQLSALRPTDIGIYSCIATNEKGSARAVARIEMANYYY